MLPYDLAHLLNTSFGQWELPAVACPEAPPGAWVRVEVRGCELLWVGRRPGSEGGLGSWRLAADPGRVSAGDEEARSLSALLLAVRRRIDPAFVPGRAIIGVRPLADRPVRRD